MDTVRQTFSIPQEKKPKCVALLEEILSLEQIPLNMLQRFQGKFVSLTLMVPAAQLYTRAVAHTISRAQRLGKPIKLTQRRLARRNFSLAFPRLISVVKPLASDALQSHWGATLSLPGGVESTGDYFGEDLGGYDIAVEEAFTLLKTL